MIDRRELLLKGTILAGAAGLAGRAPGVLASGPATATTPPDPQGGPLVVDGTNVSWLDSSYIDELEAAGVDCWVYNRVSREPSGLPFFTSVYRFLDEHSDRLAVCTTVAEIYRARRDGKIALVLGWQAATPLEGALLDWDMDPPRTDLRSYYELGLRSCGITYNLANRFGGGNLDPGVGLTKAGRYIVERFHELGIVVDVGGHTGEQASLDVLAMSAGVPIICSHTNCAALNDNPRATSDRVIEGIARSGGVVGLTALSDFVARSRSEAGLRRTPQVGVDVLLDHFDHVRRLVGAEHVGLGTDFTEGYTEDLDPEEWFIVPPEMIGLQEGGYTYVKGFEGITELPNVARGLRSRGWSEAEVRMALGENWIRVFRQVWGG